MEVGNKNTRAPGGMIRGEMVIDDEKVTVLETEIRFGLLFGGKARDGRQKKNIIAVTEANKRNI
jgi:hypothetical protein